MTSVRLQIQDQTICEGAGVPIPRVDEGIHHNGEVVRVESVAWDFSAPDGVVVVTLVVGGKPYTF